MKTNFFRSFSDDFNEIQFHDMSRPVQDGVLQALYDKGYTVKTIGKKLNVSGANIYSRIDANRGRGPQS